MFPWFSSLRCSLTNIYYCFSWFKFVFGLHVINVLNIQKKYGKMLNLDSCTEYDCYSYILKCVITRGFSLIISMFA